MKTIWHCIMTQIFQGEEKFDCKTDERKMGKSLRFFGIFIVLTGSVQNLQTFLKPPHFLGKGKEKSSLCQ